MAQSQNFPEGRLSKTICPQSKNSFEEGWGMAGWLAW